MASLIDENTQFVDSAGSPIVNGYIYVGTQNLDPVTNTITIYSDRELTVSISNPQRTDAYGRAVTRIFVPAKYSLKVEDENNVQQYLELDNGEIEQTGISLLTNVLGTDTITAEGAPAITSLVDNQQYNFRAANTNTGTVTLQIDLTAAKTIKKLHDVNLAAGDIEQNQTVAVIYNSTDDTFELVTNPATASVTSLTVSEDIVIDEATDHTSTPAAGKGIIWIKDDTPNILKYTDDAGTDFAISPIEGTFTPTLQDNTGSDSESQTYTSQQGDYIKIGNMVFFNIYLAMSSLGTLTGTQVARIANLPFNAASGTEWAISCSKGNNLNLGAANQSIGGHIRNGNDYIELYIWNAVSGTGGLQISEITLNGILVISGHYQV